MELHNFTWFYLKVHISIHNQLYVFITLNLNFIYYCIYNIVVKNKWKYCIYYFKLKKRKNFLANPILYYMIFVSDHINCTVTSCKYFCKYWVYFFIFNFLNLQSFLWISWILLFHIKRSFKKLYNIRT